MKRTLFVLSIASGLLLGAAASETSGLLGAPATAQAEDVKATRSASILAAPGEQARVVTRVRSGALMSVLDRKGRWYKVRVNGRTGWITRSSVTSGGEARTPVRTKRRRAFVEGRSRKKNSKQRAPSDRVGADAMRDGFDDEFDNEEEFSDSDDDFRESDDDFADDDFEEEEPAKERADSVVAIANTRMRKDPSGRAKSVAKARSGDRLFVIERDGKWIKVENKDGDAGWVRAKDVDDGRYAYKKYNVRYFGSLGYSNTSQNFSTPNDCDLCNYKVGSGALAVNLGADFIYDYSDEYLLAGDLSYRYTRANPGIRFVDPADGTPTDISFQAHRIDVGARAGYKLSQKTGMAAYGRVGYHYNRFGIDDVDDFAVNLPRLPSEILSGFTVGAMLDVPQLNPKFAVRVGVDMLMSGKRDQTAGLEDGLLSDASALWGTARVDYKWKPDMKITGQYQYSGLETEWQGQATASMRDHQSTSAKREDTVHALFVGLSKALE